MELIFEVVFQFLFEIILQFIVELLFELGLHSLADTLKKPRNPGLSTLGFVLWGAMAGGISLLIFPTSHIVDPDLRIANLILTPTAIGVLMMLIGKFRDKRGRKLVKLDRFGYAFMFAFVMSLVRFTWAGNW